MSAVEKMENSALESGFCRGAANEMGHSLCDKPRQTGATIDVGSTPTRTVIRIAAYLPSLCRLSYTGDDPVRAGEEVEKYIRLGCNRIAIIVES